MSWTVEYLLKFHNWWNNVGAIKTSIYNDKLDILGSATTATQSNQHPFLRIGILSAAAINYTAIFDPVAIHPHAIITGLAARSKSRAEAQIATNKRFLPGECKAYGSYDALLDDKDIDAVYIPLPNGLHHKYTIAALEKGKHVLVEKAIASNAQQTLEIRDVAARTGKIALEAFHWRFHPSAHALKGILLGGEYGRVLSMDAQMVVPAGIISRDDIRFRYDLGGGACLDLAYVFSAIAYFGAKDITEPSTEFKVIDAKARTSRKDKLVDEAMSGTIEIKEPEAHGRGQTSTSTSPTSTIRCTFHGDLAVPKLLGIIPNIFAAGTPNLTISLERAEITYTNFVGPWLSHSIAITPVTRSPTNPSKILKKGKKIELKQFKGGPQWGEELKEQDGGNALWTTYRWQLEGFVGMIRKGGGRSQDEGVRDNGYQGPWVTLDESIRVMEMIDQTYEKAGLPRRGV